jgi:4'-phosphopantetheinyl transferase
VAGRCADVAFNLSHTDGMVGVAVAMVPGLALGFDLEPLARRVPLAVARRYFTASEVAWLDGLPVPTRTEGFLRLWTLKEAFIKATGKGLTEDLSSFWFSVDPAVVSFAPDLGEAVREWSFVQRIVRAGFVAAIACRGGVGGIEAVWREIEAAGFDSAAGLPDEAC